MDSEVSRTEALQSLIRSFRGSIVSSDGDPEFDSSGVMIMEPADHGADLAQAIQVANAAGLRIIVRSGFQFKDKQESTDVQGTVVLRLTGRDTLINIEDSIIQVNASATIESLTNAAATSSFYLPIDGGKLHSIISYTLSKKSAFPCSSHLPPLIYCVRGAHIVDVNSQEPRDMTGDEFRSAVGTDPLPFIVTSLRFQRLRGSDYDAYEDRWFVSWLTNFDSSALVAVANTLFSSGTSTVRTGVDVTVRAQSGAFGISMIVVRTTGVGNDIAQNLVSDFITTTLNQNGLHILHRNEARGAKAVAAWVASSAVEDLPGASSYGDSQTSRPLADVTQGLADAAAFLVGFAGDGSHIPPGLLAWLELRGTTSIGHVFFEAQMFVDPITSRPDQVNQGRRLLEAAEGPRSPRISASETAVAAPLVLESSISLDEHPAGAGRIPGFFGDVFEPRDCGYACKSIQYATSSYDAATVQLRMRPKIIAVPKDGNDVVAAIEYAAANSLKVVARSGGHQYCGLSSGGQSALQLSMDKFDWPLSINSGVVTVGVGTPLHKLSACLYNESVALPHGECPLVGVGGHAQTGGIGHLLRNLGILADYVVAFTMVTVDTQRTAAIRRYVRPQPGAAIAAQDEIFSAVLGGGPGSWGIVLSYELQVVPDVSNTNTYGYTHIYSFSEFWAQSPRAAFTEAMRKCQDWNARLVSGQLPEGQDLFVSVVSGQCLRPAVLMVETAATTEIGQAEIKTVVDAVGKIQSPIILFGRPIDGKSTLSRIAYQGVRDRRIGMPNGREFRWPYKKSMYCTSTAIHPDFVDRFVDLVVRADGTKGIGVVVQTVVGGGKFKEPIASSVSQMQRRSSTFMLVFDIFYDNSIDGQEKVAEQFQSDLKKFLYLYSGGNGTAYNDERMFWGTFEDHDRGDLDLNISDPSVNAYYYDSPDSYRRLQEVKSQVDPLDIFHTSFTVQLPAQSTQI